MTKRLIKGDSNAFKAVFDTLYKDMVAYAGYFIDNQHMAEDIVQESFIKLWDKRKTLSPATSLKSYLHALIKNSALNHIEHLKVVDKYQKSLLQYELEENDNIEEQIEFVKDLMDKLPEKRKHILVLNVIESKKYTEIAEEMDISVNTVKDHIKKAYAFLRQEAKQNIPPFIILYFACK